MEISPKSTERLQQNISLQRETFCRGLFLSARWFVLSQVARSGLHLVVLPDSENAEYCASDLYNCIEGDRVFFLVQRTSAIGKILDYDGGLLVVVTYPEAISEGIPLTEDIRKSVIKLSKGQEIDYETLSGLLADNGFSRVDFVSAPGQYAIRGALIDIFSYADNDPYRVSFWGNEIEKITSFDCNTQLSKSTLDSVEIVPDLSQGQETGRISDILPESSLVWLDSSKIAKLPNACAKPDESRYDYTLNVSANFDVHSYTLWPHPESSYRTDELRTMIRLCKERGVDVVYVMGPYNQKAYAKVHPDELPKIQAVSADLVKVLKEEGVPYIDCTDLSTEPGVFADWQHHNSYGGYLIYQRIREYVLEKENR